MIGLGGVKLPLAPTLLITLLSPMLISLFVSALGMAAEFNERCDWVIKEMRYWAGCLRIRRIKNLMVRRVKALPPGRMRMSLGDNVRFCYIKRRNKGIVVRFICEFTVNMIIGLK
jgi:hypothetical protein